MSSSDEDRRARTPEKIKKRRGDSNIKQKHRNQRYRAAWESDPNFKGWLVPVKGTNLKARCNLCGNEFNAELTVKRRHRETEKHKKLSAQLGHGSKQQKLSDCLNLNQPPNPMARQVKVAEIRTCAYLAEHNQSLRCVDHLIKRDKGIYPDSKIAQAVVLGRTKATSIVKNVLGKAHGDELAKLLKNDKFSVIIDESTDIGSIKSLAVCVRLLNQEKGMVADYFWKIVQVFSSNDSEAANEGATAERLFNALIKTFTDSEVPINNMIGFAADNCSTMMGIHNSVASRLRTLLPGVTIQGCVCHSLHLVASEACKMLPKKPEDLARQIYGYFKNSSKRQAQLIEFQNFCNVDPHKILKPAQTRWLSLLEVVKRILEQWEPLKLFFIHHQLDARSSNPKIADKTTTLDLIVEAMNDPQVKIYYFFLEWCLPKFVHLNQIFQSEKSLITTVHSTLSSTFTELLSCYMENTYVLGQDLEKIKPVLEPSNPAQLVALSNVYLGVKVMQEFSKSNIAQHKGLELEVRTRCRNFIATACTELQKRFDFGLDSPYAKMSVLQSREVLSKASNRCPSLVSLAQIVPRIISPDEHDRLQNIDDQWRRIALTNFSELQPSDPPEKAWITIRNSFDINGISDFADVATFAIQVLSLPHASESCERVFSKINLMKTKNRNKLATDTINGLLLTSQCASLGGGCDAFPITEEMISRMTSKSLYHSKSSTETEEEESEVEFTN